MGSTFKTIPAPPPYGLSSTVLWVSLVHFLQSWVFILISLFFCARAKRDSFKNPLNNSGKIVMISNFIIRLTKIRLFNRILESHLYIQLSDNIIDVFGLAFRLDPGASFRLFYLKVHSGVVPHSDYPCQSPYRLGGRTGSAYQKPHIVRGHFDREQDTKLIDRSRYLNRVRTVHDRLDNKLYELLVSVCHFRNS